MLEGAWAGSKSEPAVETSGSGLHVSSLSFPILGRGASPARLHWGGRLFGVGGAGGEETLKLPSAFPGASPSPLSQGNCGAQPGWDRKLSLPHGSNWSDLFLLTWAWGRAGLAALWRD